MANGRLCRAGISPKGAFGTNTQPVGYHCNPNPAKDIVNITGLNSTDNVVVYDLMGRVWAQDWQVKTTGTNTFAMSSLAAGRYIVVVSDAHGAVRSRVSVQKL